MDIEAELISIGNELLSGRTLNTHARDLGGALAAIGLQLTRDTTIADHIPTIGSALHEALARTDLLFISGGLGPTSDDITREALAQALDQQIIIDHASVETMTTRYAARGRVMNPIAERQALVLEHAIVLPNSVGAAPGQRLDLDEGKALFILPGPPNEFNAILAEEIIPWLTAQFPHARPKLVRIVRTQGIGESDLVELLEKAHFQSLETDLGFYPGGGKVEIRLTAEPDHAAEISATEQTLLHLLDSYLERV